MSKYFSKAKVKYMFYTLTHPMDGFYEIRHRERGSVPLAVVSVILFSLVYSMNKMVASFIVNDTDPRTVDSLDNLGGVLLLYLLFCVGNWSITCLLNGEGRLKDIATALGYSLVPMTLCYVLATFVSQFVAQNEEGFYTIIITIGTAWTVLLAMSGIMIVHNYSLAKTMLTLVLTIIAMLIIVFIVMMLSDLVNQVYGFIYSIYTEILFRN
ncbi:MAG: YIP1 family protein [Lachnospiraceae bacterium]|nr:YIP1 family protein [Lachnospiraceae bacterium]